MFNLSVVFRIVFWAISAVAISGSASAPEQAKPQPAPKPAIVSSPSPLPNDKIDRPTSEPYTGSLSIFEDPKRAEKLQIDRVMDLLAMREGSAVADIGAGSGWFTVRAARRVGSSGLIYAVDINDEYVKHIEQGIDHVFYLLAAAEAMTRKSAATSDAPPINPPSTSGCENSSAALAGFTLPPYRIGSEPAILASSELSSPRR